MIKTPYYLIDKQKLLVNMQKIAYVREQSGAKALLALKCFATWSVFDLMQQYMDGTTSSSLYELKLGRQKFEGEAHAYSVAWADDEIEEMLANCDKIIFNSISQLQRFAERSEGKTRGLRVNPQVSSSDYLLADPARPFSRLGEWDPVKIEGVIAQISGFMFHNNCENDDFSLFDKMLGTIEERFGALLHKVEWVSLGGGIHFTGEDYAVDAFCARLKAFSEKYGVQVYLEPGEAAITNSASLEVTVLDTLYNGKHLAVVDSSIEAHLLDLLNDILDMSRLESGRMELTPAPVFLQDLLAEVETDKATMELESYEDGVLLYIGVEAGNSVAVDGVIAVIGEKGADFETLLKANAAGGSAPAPAATPPGREPPVRVGPATA